MVKKLGITKLNYEDINPKYIGKDYWISVNKYTPHPFDLVSIKIEGRLKPLSAWYDGIKWCGLRIRKNQNITHWRRKSSEQYLQKK